MGIIYLILEICKNFGNIVLVHVLNNNVLTFINVNIRLSFILAIYLFFLYNEPFFTLLVFNICQVAN